MFLLAASEDDFDIQIRHRDRCEQRARRAASRQRFKETHAHEPQRRSPYEQRSTPSGSSPSTVEGQHQASLAEDKTTCKIFALRRPCRRCLSCCVITLLLTHLARRRLQSQVQRACGSPTCEEDCFFRFSLRICRALRSAASHTLEPSRRSPHYLLHPLIRPSDHLCPAPS